MGLFTLFVFLTAFLDEKAVGFVVPSAVPTTTIIERTSKARATSSYLQAAGGNDNLSELPNGISPFEKSLAKSIDIQAAFRKLSSKAIESAISDGKKKIELEFPPLLGGDQSMTQFDDFDNVQELNKNADFCVQLLPELTFLEPTQSTYLIFPDLKECEMAKGEWTGQRYRKSVKFTCLEEVASFYTKGETFSRPWGTTFANGFNKLLGGVQGDDDNDAGLLGDRSSLDSLDDDSTRPQLHLIVQPGNGGPVEDWNNAETIHNNAAEGDEDKIPTIIVNGALDKVRDGYYAAFIFPNLAKTFPFYKSFESVFYLKPVSDKGVYGWLFRVYPEPWQVVLQIPIREEDGRTIKSVEATVALVSDSRPTYNEAVQALLSKAQSLS